MTTPIPQEYITSDLDLGTEEIIPGEVEQFCIKTKRMQLKLMGYAQARAAIDATVDNKVSQAVSAASAASSSASAANSSKNAAQSSASVASSKAQVATDAAATVAQAGQYVTTAMNAATTAQQASSQAAQANQTALANSQIVMKAATDTKTYRDEALAAQQAIDAKELKMDIIGNSVGDTRGSTRRIFQGWTYHSGAAGYRGGVGGLAPDKVIFTAGTSRIHFKLPIKSQWAMYHLKFTGHTFGANKPVDITAVGYLGTGGMYNHSEFSINDLTAFAYAGQDGHAYVRLDIGSTYYLTLAVDCLHSGNGPLMEVGSLVAIIDTADEVGTTAG